ncbi:hypothetical protein COOONC_23774, partial [Cooperia oncophora]
MDSSFGPDLRKFDGISNFVMNSVGVQFTAGSDKFIRQTSHVRVINSRLYEDGAGNWTPAKCGPLDGRLVSSTRLYNCSGLLLSENQRSDFLRQVANPSLGYLQRKALHKCITSTCKKTNCCPKCGHRNGM